MTSSTQAHGSKLCKLIKAGVHIGGSKTVELLKGLRFEYAQALAFILHPEDKIGETLSRLWTQLEEVLLCLPHGMALACFYHGLEALPHCSEFVCNDRPCGPITQ